MWAWLLATSTCELDHFKGAPDLSKRFIKVYGNEDVIFKLGSGNVLQDKTLNEVGNFQVYPLSVIHDVPCNAFVISHPEMGKLLFVTDAASFPYNVKGIDHALIEANYCEDLMQEYAIKNMGHSFNNVERVEKSHLSLQQSIEVIDRHNETLS